MVPRQQGRTHERNRPARQNLASALEPKGAVHTGLLRSLRVARPRFDVLLLVHILTPLRRKSSAYEVSQSTVRRGNLKAFAVRPMDRATGNVTTD